MISQGAAAVTARRRRWESWPLSYSGDNSEESKEQGDVSRSFKERWTSFKICLVLSSSGHKERVSDQSLAEYHLLSSEEDTRDELHKKKHNRAKVHQLPKQMGHRQSRQNWLIFFLSFFFLALCSVALAAGVYKMKNQTSAKSTKELIFFLTSVYFWMSKIWVFTEVQEGCETMKLVLCFLLLLQKSSGLFKSSNKINDQHPHFLSGIQYRYFYNNK